MKISKAVALAAPLLAACVAAACGGSSSDGSGGGSCTDAGGCGPGEQCHDGVCVPIGSGGSGGGVGGADAGVGGVGGAGGAGGAGGGVSGAGGVGGGGVGGAGGSPTDGGAGVGGVGGGTPDGGVDPVSPGEKPPPDPNLPPTANPTPTVIAFDKLFVGDTDRNFVASATAWRTFGYNLDGIISTTGGTNHCKPFAGANPSSVKTDGENGIDNSFGANLVPLMSSLTSDLSATASADIAAGNYTLLWRLLNYDPGPNDSGIDAALFGGADRGSPPLWNGSDSWPLTSDSVMNGNPNQPLYTAPASYVSGGVLVSKLDQLVVPLELSGFSLRVTVKGAILTAQISGAGASAQALNGTLAGVIDTEALIAEITKLIGSFDPSLCGSATLNSITAQIRQASDIMADGTNGDPSLTCNGISVGMGFDARAVQLGSVVTVTPTPDPCAP